MAKKWQDLKGRTMSPERQEKVRQEALSPLEELPLHDLRRARELSQAQLADVLDIAQSEVPRIEHRTDVYVSTLRRRPRDGSCCKIRLVTNSKPLLESSC